MISLKGQFLVAMPEMSDERFRDSVIFLIGHSDDGAMGLVVNQSVDDMRADYEEQLSARYAAARGFVDAVIYPEETRDVLSMALRASLSNSGPHLGPFVLGPI